MNRTPQNLQVFRFVLFGEDVGKFLNVVRKHLSDVIGRKDLVLVRLNEGDGGVLHRLVVGPFSDHQSPQGVLVTDVLHKLLFDDLVQARDLEFPASKQKIRFALDVHHLARV